MSCRAGLSLLYNLQLIMATLEAPVGRSDDMSRSQSARDEAAAATTTSSSHSRASQQSVDRTVSDHRQYDRSYQEHCEPSSSDDMLYADVAPKSSQDLEYKSLLTMSPDGKRPRTSDSHNSNKSVASNHSSSAMRRIILDSDTDDEEN